MLRRRRGKGRPSCSIDGIFSRQVDNAFVAGGVSNRPIDTEQTSNRRICIENQEQKFFRSGSPAFTGCGINLRLKSGRNIDLK